MKVKKCRNSRDPQSEQLFVLQSRNVRRGVDVNRLRGLQSSLSPTSTVLDTSPSTGEYTLPVFYPLSPPAVQSRRRFPTDAMQGERFEVLLPPPRNQKYCSFKYCALHRIFCHKLVNIYNFQ